MLYLKEINYNNVTLAKSLIIISAIFFIAMTLRFIRFSVEDKYFKSLAKITACLVMMTVLIDLTKERLTSVPLSEIDNKISVKGQRVDIDKLDEKYGYENFKQGNVSVKM